MSDDVFLDFDYDRNSEDIIERKVGDIFDIKGIRYIVVKGSCNVYEKINKSLICKKILKL